MRASVIGALIPENHDLRDDFVRRLSQTTHIDERAIEGARIVACAAAVNSLAPTGEQAVQEFDKLSSAFQNWDFSAEFPETGPSGYVVHSVQAAIQVWRQHPRDIKSALQAAVSLGGDTDSVGAIVGGIVGAGLDRVDVPDHWWRWLGWPQREEVSEALTRKTVPRARLLATHVGGLLVVLVHGFRRLLPPY